MTPVGYDVSLSVKGTTNTKGNAMKTYNIYLNDSLVATVEAASSCEAEETYLGGRTDLSSEDITIIRVDLDQ